MSRPPTRSTRSFHRRRDPQGADEPDRIKKALQLLGHEVGGLRLPLVEADDGETAEIRDCLERLGLLAAVA